MADPESRSSGGDARAAERWAHRRFYETSIAYRRMLEAPPSMSGQQRENYLAAYVSLVRSVSRPGELVLDLGCGAGLTSARIAEGGRRVIALDLSHSLMTSSPGGAGIQRVVSDVERMPFSGERFDVVTSQDLIEHTLDPEAALAEMVRVLRPDGRIVVKCPNLASPLRPLWYLARLVFQRRATPVWAETTGQALRGFLYNSVITAQKAVAGRPRFMARRAALDPANAHEDADATYYASAIDIRRWLAGHGFVTRYARRLESDGPAQSMVRRVLPDLASPVALIAERRIAR